MKIQSLSTLTDHLTRYPQMQIRDVIKLLYQETFGGGHLIMDEKRAHEILLEELDALPAGRTEPLFEPLGDAVGRLHLSAAVEQGIRPETIHRMFVRSAERIRGDQEDFQHLLDAFAAACAEGEFPFEPEQVQEELQAYRAAGCPAVRHSDRYRETYQPHYRVIDAIYREGLALMGKIDRRLAAGESVRLAIDGQAAAGKSTLAGMLADLYQCSLIHMDDFFLPHPRKTPERLREPGGNIDYERFLLEAVEPLKRGEPFTYRPYNCHTQDYGDPVAVDPRTMVIVEGAYSLHPLYAENFHLKVFYAIDPPLQTRRILWRNGERMLERFLKEWIPLESRYIEAFCIPDGCDLVLHAGPDE